MLKDGSDPNIDLNSLIHGLLPMIPLTATVAALRLRVLVLALHLGDSCDAHLRLLMGHHHIVRIIGRVNREMAW